jgi:hypothetical protein
MVPTNFNRYVKRNNFSLTMLLVKPYDRVQTVQMTLEKTGMENMFISMVQ